MSVTAFLTDSTLCIGCKACEVACKEWNQVPADGFDFRALSYDNTGSLGHSTWRHVKFVENGAVPGFGGNASEVFSWGFSSDVCKHCANAGCGQTTAGRSNAHSATTGKKKGLHLLARQRARPNPSNLEKLITCDRRLASEFATSKKKASMT